MADMLNLYKQCQKVPFGKHLFSKLACFHAPYFGSIKPVFKELKQNKCIITMKKRRSIQNHLKSVHAIAMCNVSELAAGSMVEASLPKNMRWIPKKMSVSYLKLACTDLKAVCDPGNIDWQKPGELPVTVDVYDLNNQRVFTAVITMYLSEKKKKV